MTLSPLTVDAQSVYSLTTTTGQRKGGASPPPPASFPLQYKEDFAGYAIGSTPKYWSDFAGVFEVVKRSDGKGHALRQVIDKKGIEWRPNPFPVSFCGDLNWDDYTISADALIEQSGFVSLFGRVSSEDKLYWLKVADSGDWELLAAQDETQGRQSALLRGRLAQPEARIHRKHDHRRDRRRSGGPDRGQQFRSRQLRHRQRLAWGAVRQHRHPPGVTPERSP